MTSWDLDSALRVESPLMFWKLDSSLRVESPVKIEIFGFFYQWNHLQTDFLMCGVTRAGIQPICA
jgi:hypothetical protein